MCRDASARLGVAKVKNPGVDHNTCFLGSSAGKNEKKNPFAASQRTENQAQASLSEHYEATNFHTMKSSGKGTERRKRWGG